MSYKNNKIWGIIALTLVLTLIFSTIAEAAVLRSSRIGSLSSKSSVSKTTKFKSSALNQVVQNSKIKKSTVLKSSVSSGSSKSSSSSNFKPSKASKLKQASKKSSGSSSGGSYSSSRGDQVTMTASKFSELEQRMESGEKRIIVQNPTDSQITDLVQNKNCMLTHQFSDWASLSCDENVADSVSNAVEDQIYKLQDAGSNVQIKADQVQSLGYDGDGVTVALLDSGVTLVPEIADSIIANKGFGYPDNTDSSGHGTVVSSIITGNGIDPQAKGVAPEVKIWMAHVCNINSCVSSDSIAAIDYIVNNNIAKVISISLGGGIFGGNNCDGQSPLADKVNWAVSQGFTVVAGSGNLGSGSGISSPACASGAISAGAVDSNGNRASFSQYGSALDLVAPGVNIYAANEQGGYGTGSGTSFSTPHVAGVIALLLQARPGLSDSQIKNALYSTATDLGPQGKDNEYGYGLVNAMAALDSVMNTPQSVEITALSVSNGAVGMGNYFSDIRIQGGASPYTVKILQGSLPDGLTINNNGVISGTPTTQGTFTFTVEVKDNANVKVSKQFTIQIYSSPSISVDEVPTGKCSRAYSGILRASGGSGSYVWSEEGLSAIGGLSLNSQTGEITGTITSAVAKKNKVKFKVTDSIGGTSTITMKLVVKPAPCGSAVTSTEYLLEEIESSEDSSIIESQDQEDSSTSGEDAPLIE